MRQSHLERWFPNLRTSRYQVTSVATPDYNCIAWADNDDQNWWWPPGGFVGEYWPSAAPGDRVLESFIAAFILQGYETCVGDELEASFEKVALYVDLDGLPTHAARQLGSGTWTSKLGEAEDIEHDTLAALEGMHYGTVAQIMRRRMVR